MDQEVDSTEESKSQNKVIKVWQITLASRTQVRGTPVRDRVTGKVFAKPVHLVKGAQVNQRDQGLNIRMPR